MKNIKSIPNKLKALIIISLIAVYCSCTGIISSFKAGDRRLTPSMTYTFTSTFTPTFTQTLTITPTTTFTPTFTYTNTPSPTITIPSSTSMECIPREYFEIGTVTKITDGDTIRVDINGVNYPVRLIGIDAPEITTTGGYVQQGIDYLKNLILNKEVTLFRDKSNTDKYDRLLRYVVIGNTFVNYELVKLGFAKSVLYYPDTACNLTFNTAQSLANNNLIGMWAPTIAPKPSGIINNPDPNCSPYYPDVCIPNYPPDLNCKDIPYRRFRVLPPDPHNFDGDGDGIGCEK